MFNILVVDDNKDARILTSTVLTQNGYKAFEAQNGCEGLEMLDKTQIDLIVLDVMMPGMNGYEFAKILRDNDWNLPILMVTAKETMHDKKMGFISGTDDYMVKPVDEEEFLLRIAALLRRAKIANEHKLSIGDTVINYDELSVSYSGNSYVLPKKEFQLLFKLLSYKDKIFTRRQLMDEIWDMETETDERTVDVHINRLRERFKDNEDFKIITIRGLGYKATF